MSLIWIQGAGEQASGVAWRLCRAGYRVVMAERPRPTTVRRLVAFSEAVHEGEATVEGLTGTLVEAGDLIGLVGAVQVAVDPEAGAMERLRPAAVVDARLTKRHPEPLPHGEALMIGLGPGFLVGRDADLIIETHREARCGSVIHQGEAAAATGVPGRVGGKAAERVLRAPAAGFLQTDRSLGDLVWTGEIIGEIGGIALKSTLDGRLRGLIHPSVELFEGMKVGDVDPRGEAIDPGLVSDKALAIGGGVLEALLSRGIGPAAVAPIDTRA